MPLVSTLAKDGRLGATMGAAGPFKELGNMIGPLLIGVLSQAFGLADEFFACDVLGLLTPGMLKVISLENPSRSSDRINISLLAKVLGLPPR